MEDQLIDAVLELNEDLAIDIVSQRMREGVNPVSIISLVQEGVNRVGIYYNQGRYFIADLIMSGLIFKEVIKLIQFPPEDSALPQPVKAIFATVERDIHDIGKNIAVTYFNSKGIHPVDLGVNVPPAVILEHITKDEPVVLFLSGLITSSYYSMKKTIHLLKEKNLRGNVIVVICGLVDEEVKNYVEADYFVKDIVESYELYVKLSADYKRISANPELLLSSQKLHSRPQSSIHQEVREDA
ncbi:MAG: putative cobalamin binding protein [Bacillota bacterium]|nr:putative cobalamin binding protein [Bacillota bacterium]